MSARLAGRRAIIVLGGLELGGSERQALHLARWLKQTEAMQVEIWGFSPPGQAAILCDQIGVAWRSLPFPWKAGWGHKLSGLWSFWQTLRRARPEILLPYTVLPNILCGLTWRLSGARLCLWNQRDAGDRSYSFKMQRLAARLTPAFAANSSTGAAYLQQGLGVAGQKIRLIPNGVVDEPPAQDRAAWRRQMGVGEQDFVACMIANLRQPKDHATLIRAWRQVIDQTGPAARLALAGQPMEAAPALQDLTRQLGLEDQVLFLGQVSDVSGLLQAADLGVFSSRSEGSPNGVLEAMAAGLAVVATDLPGIRAACGEGDDCLAAPGDAAGLAQRILALYADAGRRARLGQANRQRVAREFSLEAMCQATSQYIAAQLPPRRGG